MHNRMDHMEKMLQMMKMKRLKISGGKTLGDGVCCEKENLKTMVMVVSQ